MKKRILVVDDDPDVTAAICAVLRENDRFEVDAVNDPHEAFEMTSARPYDLLISDVQMPNLNGEMLYLCMGIDPKDPLGSVHRPKLLLISGALTHAELQAAIDFIGGAAYLQKPFDAQMLKEKVLGILGML